MVRSGLSLGVAVIVMWGCDQAAGRQAEGLNTVPTGPAGLQSGTSLVDVTRVRAFIKDDTPQVYIEGNIGDGCTALSEITQSRQNNTVVITVPSTLTDGPCVQSFALLNRWVLLQGPFAPGAYIVRANTASQEFRLIAEAGKPLRVDPDPGPLPTTPPDTGIPGVVVPTPTSPPGPPGSVPPGLPQNP